MRNIAVIVSRVSNLIYKIFVSMLLYNGHIMYPQNNDRIVTSWCDPKGCFTWYLFGKQWWLYQTKYNAAMPEKATV